MSYILGLISCFACMFAGAGLMYDYLRKHKRLRDAQEMQYATGISTKPRIVDADRLLNQIVWEWEKNGRSMDALKVTEYAVEAKRAIGGCIYPDGPCGCNCTHECKAVFKDGKFQ